MAQWYEYLCSSGHPFELFRMVDQRNDAAICPRNPNGAPAVRRYSVPTIHWPRSLWTQWGDVHTRSEKELAHDPTVERYDPTAPVAKSRTDPKVDIKQAYTAAREIHGSQ